MKFFRAALLMATAQASRTEGDHEDAVALQFSHSAPLSAAVTLTAVAMAPSHHESLVEMEALAQSVIQGGATIDDATKNALHDVKASLTDSSEKGIKDAHAADLHLRRNAYQAVQQCQNNFAEAESDNAAIGTQVEAKSQIHKDCRAALQGLIDDDDKKCTAMSNFLAALNPPSCAVPGRDGMAHYISALETYQASLKVQWPLMEGACKAAEDARADKRQECQLVQGAFEGSFCSFRQDLYASCAEMKRCFSTADAELRRLLDISDASAESRQTEWVAIQKIKCYVDVLLSAEDNLTKQGAMTTCHNLNPDVDELKLPLVTPLTIQECDLSPVANYPCTDLFESTRYAGLAEIAQCQPCPDLPGHLITDGAATTAAPKAEYTLVGQGACQDANGKNFASWYGTLDATACGQICDAQGAICVGYNTYHGAPGSWTCGLRYSGGLPTKSPSEDLPLSFQADGSGPVVSASGQEHSGQTCYTKAR